MKNAGSASARSSFGFARKPVCKGSFLAFCNSVLGRSMIPWPGIFLAGDARPRDERRKDLLRPALDQIIDLGHPRAQLVSEIDWRFLDGRLYPRASVQANASGADVPAHAPEAIRDIRRKIARPAGSTARLRSAPRPHHEGQRPGPPPARAQGLIATRARAKMHQQRESPALYEFGCKVSIAMPVTSPTGGQFVLHAKRYIAIPSTVISSVPLSPT